MATESHVHLHPQNSVIPDRGLQRDHGRPRGPYRYLKHDGDVLHHHPLCPDLRGTPYYVLGAEDALYAVGERHCDTCSYPADPAELLGGE